MKKLILTSLLLGSTGLAHADYKLVTTDGSPLSSLCIAAATSPADMYELAQAHGIGRHEIDSVRCNDLTLKRFVLKYGAASTPTQTTSRAVAGYVLRKTDSSPLTELCAAAIISDQEMAKVKETYFSEEREIESQVLCNGEPLKSFARKFRNAGVSLVGLR